MVQKLFSAIDRSKNGPLWKRFELQMMWNFFEIIVRRELVVKIYTELKGENE
jgi:hypothetical protein